MSFGHAMRNRTKKELSQLKEDLSRTYHRLREIELKINPHDLTTEPQDLGQLMVEINRLQNIVEMNLTHLEEKIQAAGPLSNDE